MLVKIDSDTTRVCSMAYRQFVHVKAIEYTQVHIALFDESRLGLSFLRVTFFLSVWLNVMAPIVGRSIVLLAGIVPFRTV